MTTTDPIDRAAQALRSVYVTGSRPDAWPTSLAEYYLDLSHAAFASIDHDKLTRVIHESGPCDDRDCTDPDDRGYCDKRADAILAWLTGGEPRG